MTEDTGGTPREGRAAARHTPLTDAQRALASDPGHVALARKVAAGVVAWKGSHRDADEVRSAAFWGLIQAARAYDPTRGVRFTTFAMPRIKGACLDALREVSMSRRVDRPRLVSLQAVAGTGWEMDRFLGELAREDPDPFAAADYAATADRLAGILPRGTTRAVFRAFAADPAGHGAQKAAAAAAGVTESRASQVMLAARVAFADQEPRVRRIVAGEVA